MDFLGIAGKLVLVTGATMGIGKGIAEQYLQAGAHVILNGRTAERLEATVHDLTDNQGFDRAKMHIAIADVSTADGVRQLWERVDEIGNIDVLICNVGIFFVKEFVETTDEEWQRYFDVNVMSAVRLCRYYLPKFLARNSGRIILIASEAGMRPIPHLCAYSVSKTALIGLGRAMAESTKGTRVTVNSVLVGPTWTEGVEEYITGLALKEQKPVAGVAEDYFKVHEPTSLIQRFLTTTEVGKTVVFLGSDAASGINGTAQKVEGGIIRSL